MSVRTFSMHTAQHICTYRENISYKVQEYGIFNGKQNQKKNGKNSEIRHTYDGTHILQFTTGMQFYSIKNSFCLFFCNTKTLFAPSLKSSFTPSAHTHRVFVHVHCKILATHGNIMLGSTSRRTFRPNGMIGQR